MKVRARVVMFVFLAGCGETATIRQGTIERDARILRSTQLDLIVAARGGEEEIPRSTITDIDHPGNVLAVAGVPLIALGIANLLGKWNCGDGQPHPVFCMSSGFGVLVLSTGFVVSFWGLDNYARSKTAAAPPAP
jgi:hypothetical protein